jgi:Arc/MetJ family transcription regulator
MHTLINEAYGMRTTLDLPEDLIEQAMKLTKAKSKTELIRTALKNIIDQEKRNNLIRYHGKVNIDLDLDELRDR